VQKQIKPWDRGSSLKDYGEHLSGGYDSLPEREEEDGAK